MTLYLDHVGSEALVQLAKCLLRHDWVLEARVKFHFPLPHLAHAQSTNLVPLRLTVSDFIFTPGAAIPASLVDLGLPDESLAESALETEIFAFEPYLVAGPSQFMPIAPCSVHVGKHMHASFALVSTLH
jgi:hypothetical protein